MPDDRFNAPIDNAGTWSVIDADRELPAIVRGRPLVGLREAEAKNAVDLLATVERLRMAKQKPPVNGARSAIHPFVLPIR